MSAQGTPTEGAAPTPRKKRIVVLGSGVGAVTTAYYLTDRPGWEEDYEVHLYQMGWRLGGKGASGRNKEKHQRIQEHGLHIWFGYYENAFRTMRDCYDKLGRTSGAIKTWQDAFKKQSRILLMNKVGDDWKRWDLPFPEYESEPGDPTQMKIPESVWGYVVKALELLFGLIENRDLEYVKKDTRGLKIPWWLRWAFKLLGETGIDSETAENFVLRTAIKYARRIDRLEDFWLLRVVLRFVLKWILRFVSDIADKEIADATEEVETHQDNKMAEVRRQLWIAIELSVAHILGMLADNVVDKGFHVIDHLDYRAWLKKHTASKPTRDSAPIDAIYQLWLARPENENMAAGTALRATLRMILLYEGAIMWKMQCGMGDIVFGPFYQLLKRRGVKFHFFQKVVKLKLSPDQQSIDEIVMESQAVVKGGGEYEPLVDIKGVPSWPSEPLYDQLEDGDDLRKHNLESHWTMWKGEQYSLKVVPPDATTLEDDEFDSIVMGISVAGLKGICDELCEAPKNRKARKRWRQMLDKVTTIPTYGLQLWLNRDYEELGCDPPPVLMTGYQTPLDSWGDMGFLLDREAWPADMGVKSVQYFCDSMVRDPGIPSSSHHHFPQEMQKWGEAAITRWLNNHVRPLWKDATDPDNPEGVNWNILIDPDKRSGSERLKYQLLKVNIDPSERYVLSESGTIKYRMRADESGYTNLILTGDWLLNGLNTGCVESATMSGMQASRAICGHPVDVFGEHDIPHKGT